MDIRFSTRKKASIGILIMLVLLVAISPVYANSAREEQERAALFLASRQMLAEQQAPAKTRAGIFVTNYGEDAEVSLGGRVESNMDSRGQVWLLAEAINLKEEKEVAGFIGLKLIPAMELVRPLYIGLGLGLREESRIQFFGGLELTENLFVELKCISDEVRFDEEDVYVGAGFQLSF